MRTNTQVVYDAVWELTQGKSSVEFTISEVKKLIEKKDPTFKLRSVESRIIKDCVNHDSHEHHPRVNNFYWRVGDGKYRLCKGHTVIRPEAYVNDGVIFSNDCWGYAISKDETSSDTVLYVLHACLTDNDEDHTVIAVFGDDKAREDALFALDELLQAINRGDSVFDFANF